MAPGKRSRYSDFLVMRYKIVFQNKYVKTSLFSLSRPLLGEADRKRTDAGETWGGGAEYPGKVLCFRRTRCPPWSTPAISTVPPVTCCTSLARGREEHIPRLWGAIPLPAGVKPRPTDKQDLQGKAQPDRPERDGGELCMIGHHVKIRRNDSDQQCDDAPGSRESPEEALPTPRAPHTGR